MTTHPADTAIDAALRDLDPARATTLTETEHARADATLARILAGPDHAHVPEASGRRRRSRLLVPLGLVGAVGAAVPALLLGGGSAFASWTPAPEPLVGAAVGEAATTCRTALGLPDRGERAVLAERRGGWTYVLIVGAASEGTCLMPDDVVGQQDPARHEEEGFFGSVDTDPVEAPAPAADRLVETGSTAGSVSVPGLRLLDDDEEWFSSVQGSVGEDVTAVTVHTPVGPDVKASVAHGRFAAWWPSDRPSGEHPDVMGAWTYTLTLADGSTRRFTG